MSYNGSGTFNINTTGQPVVAGTVISSSAFNALTTDLATGLTTAITKDGQTTTTARITFAQGITSSLVTDSSSVSTGSIITAGGAGIAKNLYVGVNANVAGTLGVTGVATFSAAPIYSSLTASSAVATDASKGLVSVTNTGTGNNVLATSPTITTPTISSLSSASATALTLQSAGTTAMTIDTSQRVLIGTTSASYGKLVISGASADVAMQIADTASTTAGIGFNGSGSTNGVGAPTGTLYFGQYNGFPMVFTTNNAERMRIASDGKVGIGTSSPGEKLDVAGAIRSNVSGGTPAIYFGDGTYQTSITGQSNSIRFIGDAGAERMRIDSSGNLLVGTTSAGSGATAGLFRVSKTSGNGIYSEAATTAAGYRYISNALSDGGTYYHFNFTEGGTQRGSITSNGSNTSYTTSSDYRLKENIQPLTGALSLVSRLKPSAFRWKETGTEDSGFIAHELQEVCPSAVTGEKNAVDADGNPKYQSVDTSFLVATLTAALQETKALIDTQAETINALTARIVALENK